MISGLKPYPKCKDSGVPWVGQVPEHWQIAAVRHRYSQCLGKMLDSKRITGNNSLPYLRNTDVQWDRINIERLPRMDIQRSEYDRFTVREGDLLVCEGGEVGRCATWSGDNDVCGFQKALHRLRPLKASHDLPRFMYYALRAATECSAFDDGHVSTIAHLTGNKLRAHRFPFPPFDEQAAVVRFLDCADRRIRRFIRVRQKLIKLLEEQKQAIIHRAVTRGLDPSVRLKPSGVDWLGDVPEHWEVRPLRALCRVVGRIGYRGYTQADIVPSGVGAVSLSPSNIIGNELQIHNNTYISWAKYEESPEIKVRAGDIVFVKTGSTTGKVALVIRVQEPMTINPQLVVLKDADGSSEFLTLALSSVYVQTQVKVSVIGGSTPTITQAKIGAFQVAWPSLSEQRKIVDRVKREGSRILATTSRASHEIELLREFRTRLIADVVTGKIDVREASARLPEEVEEPDLPDETETEDDTDAVDTDDATEVPEEADA
jgi:type I restriction enzyme S subunit